MIFIGIPTIDETMGSILIGTLLASCLLGVSLLQATYYFIRYWKRDPWSLRLFVATVALLDTVHQILISHTIYTYLITNYNQPDFLARCVWSLLLEVLFNGFIGLLVQCFLLSRIWHLGHNIFLTSLIMILILGEFGCITAFAIIGLIQIHTFQELARLKSLSVTVNALSAASDILLAVTLIWLLWHSRTGFQRSDTIIRKLITFVLNTGFLTTISAIGSLASILAAPTTFIYICLFFCNGRLYVNSSLATLNVRDMIQEAANKRGMSIHMSHIFSKCTVQVCSTTEPEYSFPGVSINSPVETPTNPP